MEKKLIRIKLDDIREYENNPRNNDASVEAIVHSVEECGYVAPIVIDEENVILAGHSRYKALLEIGDEYADCIKVSGLSANQKKLYRITDNKTNEYAKWDYDLLREEAGGLDFGFDFGIDDLLNAGENLKKAEKKKTEPIKKRCTCPRCGCEFE